MESIDLTNQKKAADIFVKVSAEFPNHPLIQALTFAYEDAKSPGAIKGLLDLADWEVGDRDIIANLVDIGNKAHFRLGVMRGLEGITTRVVLGRIVEVWNDIRALSPDEAEELLEEAKRFREIYPNWKRVISEKCYEILLTKRQGLERI